MPHQVPELPTSSSKKCVVGCDGTLSEVYSFFLLQDDGGRTARDACCVFGGEITIDNTTSFQDQVNGWSIDIYGNEFGVTPAPTPIDSSPPSSGPSTSLVSTTASPRLRQHQPALQSTRRHRIYHHWMVA